MWLMALLWMGELILLILGEFPGNELQHPAMLCLKCFLSPWHSHRLFSVTMPLFLFSRVQRLLVYLCSVLASGAVVF